MKKIIRLNEKQITSLVNDILSEQRLQTDYNKSNNIYDKYIKNISDGVYTDFDKVYDYKLQNGVWYTKKKNGSKWIDLTNYPKAITVLSGKIKEYIKKRRDKDKIVPKKTTPKPVDKSDTIVSKTTNKEFINKILVNDKQISPTTSVRLFDAGQPECARFVNDFDNQFDWIGNAWQAHNNDMLGQRVFSSFTNLNETQIKTAIELWVKLDKKGGGVKVSAPNDFGDFVGTLVPKSPSVTLQLNDIVGIYLPSSPNHEIAFYEGGLNPGEGNKPYIQKINGKYVPGNSIKSGKGWGMNTHLGIVGAIKDGVPIIFHNIHGQVFSDPFNKLTDDARIAWVRRPGGEPIALSQLKSSMYVFENDLVNRLKKKHLTEQKINFNKYNKYSCIIEPGFRPVISQLLSEGYNKKFLKASLAIIGRESSFSSGLRYNITSPLKTLASFFGSNTSIGPAQMKQSTADELKLKESILTLRGSLIAVYKYLQRSYTRAKMAGYSPTKPSSNFNKGTGDAALDIAIASYNMGIFRIVEYCSTNDPKVKRNCALSGKIVEQSVIGASGMGVIGQKSNPNDNVKKTKYKVTNQVSKNYLPNFKTQRWDGVDISTHGYVEEVTKHIKEFTCF